MILPEKLYSSESSGIEAVRGSSPCRLLKWKIAVMKKLMRIVMICLAIISASGLISSEAQACPGCKNANETDTLRPRAYMYSILFMLGMPATVFTGFGIAFYRMSRRAMQEQQEQLAQLTSEVTE